MRSGHGCCGFGFWLHYPNQAGTNSHGGALQQLIAATFMHDLEAEGTLALQMPQYQGEQCEWTCPTRGLDPPGAGIV